MMRSILIGLDGTQHSRAAVELGLQWARRYDALLIGLGVVNEPSICRREPLPIGGGGFKHQRDEVLLTEARLRVGQIVTHFTRRCALEGVSCKAMQRNGSPDVQILEQSRQCDLIMLGQETNFQFVTQDWSDETLEQVLRQSICPVVTVPEGASRKASRIVVAFDGGPQSHRSMQMFQSLGLAGEDEVCVVSIDANAEAAEQLTREAVEYLRLHEVQARAYPRACDGPVSQVLLRVVEELQPRLLVIGAYGRSSWREFAFGSTTSEVLRTSSVPVFLCH